jgi:alkanesulfonate monooxygenase SsuD/methylene tetrahydromethanopterin reductase-like flavin-dependent oxidoreductase (luciferase family)
MMNGFLIGADRDDLRARARRLAEWRGHGDQARADVDAYIAAVARPWIVGTPEAFRTRLREYEAAGVERVMLQHHLFEDFEALELLGAEIIPALAT